MGDILGDMIVTFRMDEAGQYTDMTDDYLMVIGEKVTPDGPVWITRNVWGTERLILKKDVDLSKKAMWSELAVYRIYGQPEVVAFDMQSMTCAEHEKLTKEGSVR